MMPGQLVINNFYFFMFCKNCGSKIEDGLGFCGNCKKPIVVKEKMNSLLLILGVIVVIFLILIIISATLLYLPIFRIK